MSTTPTWVTVPLRLALGVVFIAHGSQKVLGQFGGPGLSGFIGGSTPFSFMRPAWLWLGAAAFFELIGGILVLIGLFTRLGAFLLICVMLTAVIGIHHANFFANHNGFEYPMSLLAMALALLGAGGGEMSVDRAVAGGRK
jgi:putative oxidoreductase